MAVTPENAETNEPSGKWTMRIVFATCLLLTAALLFALFFSGDKQQPRSVGWDAISFVSPPPWDQTEFLKELQRTGGWSERLEISDPSLLEKLNRVCSTHPRVAKVRSISFVSPERVQLDLQFRVPVARLNHDSKWYLVDHDGYLLKPLVSESVGSFLELIGWDSLLLGDDKGKSWLVTATRLAEVLQKDRAAWSLESIVLVRQPVLGSELRLQTLGKQQIIWQTLDNTGPAEPTDEDKLNRLRAYFAEYKEIPAGKMLDMRSKEGIRRLDRSP
jgi:hypothetical protein